MTAPCDEQHPFRPGGGHEDFGYALVPLCRVCRQTLTEGPHLAASPSERGAAS